MAKKLLSPPQLEDRKNLVVTLYVAGAGGKWVSVCLQESWRRAMGVAWRQTGRRFGGTASQAGRRAYFFGAVDSCVAMVDHFCGVLFAGRSPLWPLPAFVRGESLPPLLLTTTKATIFCHPFPPPRRTTFLPPWALFFFLSLKKIRPCFPLPAAPAGSLCPLRR